MDLFQFFKLNLISLLVVRAFQFTYYTLNKLSDQYLTFKFLRCRLGKKIYVPPNNTVQPESRMYFHILNEKADPDYDGWIT